MQIDYERFYLLEYLILTVFNRTADNQRGPRLVNENAVHLIDDGKLKSPLDKIAEFKLHVVPEIVEPEFIVGSVGNVAAVRLFPFHIIHPVDNDPDREAEGMIDPPHPLGVSSRQVIIDRHQVGASTCQRI